VIYLNYDGIKGNVTAEGYKDMIRLRHFKFDLFRSSVAGSEGKRAAIYLPEGEGHQMAAAD